MATKICLNNIFSVSDQLLISLVLILENITMVGFLVNISDDASFMRRDYCVSENYDWETPDIRSIILAPSVAIRAAPTMTAPIVIYVPTTWLARLALTNTY